MPIFPVFLFARFVQYAFLNWRSIVHGEFFSIKGGKDFFFHEIKILVNGSDPDECCKI